MIRPSSLLWKLMLKGQKNILLDMLLPLDARQLGKMMSGRLKLPECFDSRKAIFIHIPKTAGTTICQDLFGSGGLGHNPYVWYQRIAEDKCMNYFTFAIVRNPWDRVVSAYHYLLQGGAVERDSGWSKVINNFSGFDDFVKNWMCAENIEKQIHFIPQYRFLENKYGVIDLNYIGRFESLAESVKEIRSHMGEGSDSAPRLNVVNSSGTDGYRGYYTDSTKKIVGRLYARDIELFEYSF